MTTMPERVATLEANDKTKDKDIQDIKSSMDDMMKTMHSIDNKVGEINLKVEKSMSFIGGIAFTFSMMGAVFVVVLRYVLSKFGVEI